MNIRLGTQKVYTNKNHLNPDLKWITVPSLITVGCTENSKMLYNFGKRSRH